jgi:MOSC domain-containing protein YiiM
VRTGVWKTPVTGRIFARRLNLDGDGQGDLGGHGGEQRALLVYQLDSYRYWATYLGRRDLVAGNFGENLTVEGLADNEVCIGDRFRIGGAVVEVSQPRDTCYRVGIRLNHPGIAALLVAHRRPGPPNPVKAQIRASRTTMAVVAMIANRAAHGSCRHIVSALI